MSVRSNRRDFVKRSALVAGASMACSVAAPYVLSAPEPSKKLGVAVIGGDGMGQYSTGEALKERFVALVEIEDSRMANVMKRVEAAGQKPKTYYDYRKMLDECHKEIDVVLIATPDHNHAPAAIRAIHLGKHVFCQKPLAHNIRECYELAKAAKEKKVLTQMGNQGHCGETIRRVVEFIWAGAIGNVLETHTILGRNFGGKGGRPPSKPVPPGLHWDEWLGPAPYRDYHDGLHPFSWRSWRQFGTGTIGDMACHHFDAPFWALKIYEAKHWTVECLHTTGGSEEMFPQDNVVLYHIPARGNMPPLKFYAYDHAGLKPQVMIETEKKYDRKFGEFCLFVGDRGMMGSDGYIIPQEKHKEFKQPEKTLPRAHGGPIEDLYWAIRNDGVPCSNFVDSAGPLTAFALCGLLAQFAGVGKKVEWDVEKMQCTNMPELNQYVRREYRKGWEV